MPSLLASKVADCRSKVEAAYHVDWLDVIGFGKERRLSEARAIAVCYLYQAGLSCSVIGTVFKGRTANGVSKYNRIGLRMCRGTTAANYLRALTPEPKPVTPPDAPKMPDWHTRQILHDKSIGMTPHETLYHWPFFVPVSLHEIKQIRGEA